MDSITVSHTRPDYTDAELLLGMVNPIPRPPIFAIACPVIILGNIGLIYAIKEMGFLAEFTNSITEYYYTYKTNHADSKVLKFQLMTTSFMAALFGLLSWTQFHHYWRPMYNHLQYPGT